MQEMWVRSLGWEDPLEKEMTTHSSILAWEIPCTEEPGGLPSMGSQKSRTQQRLNNNNTVCSLFTYRISSICTDSYNSLRREVLRSPFCRIGNWGFIELVVPWKHRTVRDPGSDSKCSRDSKNGKNNGTVCSYLAIRALSSSKCLGYFPHQSLHKWLSLLRNDSTALLAEDAAYLMPILL